jgi:hypothetical protein
MTATDATTALEDVDRALVLLESARERMAGTAAWHLSADLRDQIASLRVSRGRLWRMTTEAKRES